MEYNCFTMLCYSLLYNKVNQLYGYIYPFPLEPTSTPSNRSRSSQSTKLSFLCYTAVSTSSFTYYHVHMLILISQFIPPSPSPLWPQVCSLCPCVYSCPAERLISTIFPDYIYTYIYIYVLIYDICFSDLLHSM